MQNPKTGNPDISDSGSNSKPYEVRNRCPIAILAGAAAAGAAYFLERTLGYCVFDRFYEIHGDSYGFILADAFLRTAVIEEAVRYLALTAAAGSVKDSRRHTISAALLVGTGFWLAETAMYFCLFGLRAVALRLFPAWGTHAALSVFAGCALSAGTRKERAACILTAVALHGLYDTAVSLPAAGTLALLLAVWLIIAAVIAAAQKNQNYHNI